MNLGDFDAATILYHKFPTYRPSTGATFTLGGTPAISVYKDNSTTQSTAGVTLTADFDSVTGLNHVTVDTSSDGAFYSAGSIFHLVITTGTVDSVSVTGAVVGWFTIRKTSSLKAATAGRTLVVDAAGLADANVVKLGPTGAGTAQTARDVGASVIAASVTGNVGGNVVGSVASVTGNVGGNVVGSVASVTGAVASVTGNVGGNVVGSVASVTANVNADVKKINGTTVTGDGSVGTPWGP